MKRALRVFLNLSIFSVISLAPGIACKESQNITCKDATATLDSREADFLSNKTKENCERAAGAYERLAKDSDCDRNTKDSYANSMKTFLSANNDCK